MSCSPGLGAVPSQCCPTSATSSPKHPPGRSGPCCYLSRELCSSVPGVASSPRSSSTRGWYSRTILRKPCRKGIVLCPCTAARGLQHPGRLSKGLLPPFKTNEVFSRFEGRRKHSLLRSLYKPSPAQGSPPTHRFGVSRLSPAGRAAHCGYRGTAREGCRRGRPGTKPRC